MQVSQRVHPPKRSVNGRVPFVHKGFHACWHGSCIRSEVLQCVCEVLGTSSSSRAADGDTRSEGQHAYESSHNTTSEVHSRASKGDMQVITCGHSLGGALASLAAIDIVRECGVDSDRVSCYTFGCPRIGNHAFAADYAQAVPDTWHVINDQDIVVRFL